MFSALSLEQRRRREALRAAKDLCRMNMNDPDPTAVVTVAQYILSGEIVVNGKIPPATCK